MNKDSAIWFCVVNNNEICLILNFLAAKGKRETYMIDYVILIKYGMIHTSSLREESFSWHLVLIFLIKNFNRRTLKDIVAFSVFEVVADFEV